MTLVLVLAGAGREKARAELERVVQIDVRLVGQEGESEAGKGLGSPGRIGLWVERDGVVLPLATGDLVAPNGRRIADRAVFFENPEQGHCQAWLRGAEKGSWGVRVVLWREDIVPPASVAAAVQISTHGRGSIRCSSDRIDGLGAAPIAARFSSCGRDPDRIWVDFEIVEMP